MNSEYVPEILQLESKTLAKDRVRSIIDPTVEWGKPHPPLEIKG
jgi:hypothetical protein